MILHEEENEKLFSEAIRLTAEEFDVPQSYVEKDYYLTKALLNISRYENSQHIVFKGGTSLSKVYKAIYRFSEDIDLAVLPEDDWSPARITRVMKKAFEYGEKDLTDSGIKFSNGSKFRKKRYYFPRVNKKEELGEVKDTILIECNAFTTPSPIEVRKIRTLIAEWAIRKENKGFIEQFLLQDFTFSVLCWKRTFCEKLLGLMASATRNDLSDKVRHFYDVTILCRNKEIYDFLNSNEFYQMMELSVENDIRHAGNREQPWIVADLSLNQPFINFIECWEIVSEAYDGDFQKMVTRPDKSPVFDEIFKVFSLIKDRLSEYSKQKCHIDCLQLQKDLKPDN